MYLRTIDCIPGHEEGESCLSIYLSIYLSSIYLPIFVCRSSRPPQCNIRDGYKRRNLSRTVADAYWEDSGLKVEVSNCRKNLEDPSVIVLETCFAS